MATIQRPTKQGNATTYQGKVAAGYTTILASEMDADLDLIYSAWNQGVDGSNIQPGVITGNMLAPGAVGTRELQDGGIQTVDIGDGQVNNAKISDVQWNKLIGGTVAAGGDLAGVYPYPALGTVHGGIVDVNPRARFIATTGEAEITANDGSSSGYDATKPSWLLRLNYASDDVTLFRAPAGSPNGWQTLLSVTGVDSKTHLSLSDDTVSRKQIQVNAVNGAGTFVANPTGFVVSTTGWQTVASLSVTTRGGLVHLWACACMSAFGPGATGGYAWLRWLCDGASVVQSTHLVSTANPTYVPVPDLCWLHNPAAGTHTYTYQVAVDANMTLVTASQAGGGYMALEVG